MSKKLIHYWERGVADTTHDQEGNPMVEVVLYLKLNREEGREAVIDSVEDFLEELL